MRQTLVKITFRWRKYAISTLWKMGPGPNRNFSNLLFHGICLSWCIFQGRIWIKAKNDKNSDKINSEMSLSILQHFWAQNSMPHNPKNVGFWEKVFCTRFFHMSTSNISGNKKISWPSLSRPARFLQAMALKYESIYYLMYSIMR